jgi:hypothetical protein
VGGEERREENGPPHSAGHHTSKSLFGAPLDLSDLGGIPIPGMVTRIHFITDLSHDEMREMQIEGEG